MTPSEPEPEGGAAIFMRIVREHLDAIAATQKEAPGGGRLCREAIRRDGMIWLFGTGHSHLLAIEGHHRAGGLACVCPVLGPGLMMHEGADLGTRMERLPGLAAIVLDHYPMRAGDVLFVFSNSGINAVPVEAALTREGPRPERGCRAGGGLCARPEARAGGQEAGRHRRCRDRQSGPARRRAGARVQGELRTGPGSTGHRRLHPGRHPLRDRPRASPRIGIDPPVYISSNMPGAEEHNARLVARYRPRNPHL